MSGTSLRTRGAIAALVLAAVLPAQRANVWDARSFVREAPRDVGGKLRNARELSWSKGSAHAVYRGAIAHVGDALAIEPDLVLVAGLTADLRGALDLLRLDATRGFVSIETKSYAAVHPLLLARDAQQASLWVTDPEESDLLTAGWSPDTTLPAHWDTILGAERMSELDPGSTMRADPNGGVDLFVGPLGYMRVYCEGGTWTTRAFAGDTDLSGLRIDTPVSTAGPLVVRSHTAGRAFLECVARDSVSARQKHPSPRETRTLFGWIGEGSDESALPPEIELRAENAYRLVLDVERNPVSPWFRPRAIAGRSLGFGALGIAWFDAADAHCEPGSPRAGSSLRFTAAQSDGEATVLSWFAVDRPDRAAEITTTGALAFLRADSVLLQCVAVHPDRQSYRAGALYTIPDDDALLGRMLYTQSAVLGPGPDDLALTPVIGIVIDDVRALLGERARPVDVFRDAHPEESSADAAYRDDLFRRLVSRARAK